MGSLNGSGGIISPYGNTALTLQAGALNTNTAYAGVLYGGAIAGTAGGSTGLALVKVGTGTLGPVGCQRLRRRDDRLGRDAPGRQHGYLPGHRTDLVSSGGVLAGNGSTGTGTVTLTGGSRITGGTGAGYGDTIGALGLGGNLNLSGGAYTVKLDLADATGAANKSGGSGGGTYSDQLLISGSLLTNGSGTVLTISPLVLSTTPVVGTTYSFAIAQDAGAPFTAVLLAKLALSSTTDASGDRFALSDSADGTELFLDVNAAPEPTSLLLAGLAAAPVALGRRRRRARA